MGVAVDLVNPVCLTRDFTGGLGPPPFGAEAKLFKLQWWWAVTWGYCVAPPPLAIEEFPSRGAPGHCTRCLHRALIERWHQLPVARTFAGSWVWSRVLASIGVFLLPGKKAAEGRIEWLMKVIRLHPPQSNT
jgi:hypothetical protein